MKIRNILVAILAIMSISGTTAFAQTPDDEKKILVAYYSLRNGNTRLVAEEIQKRVGGEIFRIETVNAYPAQYNDVTAQAKKELESGYRPELSTSVQNFDQYDTIYLGSPNWWGTIAPAVMTFLESNNFKGKTIIPFITHEGSRMGNSVDDIKKLAPQATVFKGLPIRGGSAANAGADVERWLKELGQTK